MSEGSQLVLLLAQIVTAGSALIVTFHPNILHASVALLFSFLGVAVMFLFAGADFLAGAQMVIYIGGITILILFAIMLTQWMYQVTLKDLRARLLLPLIVAFVGLVPFLYQALSEITQSAPMKAADKVAAFSQLPKTTPMGESLLGAYLLPFEAITILLLGALVGAVWLARPSK